MKKERQMNNLMSMFMFSADIYIEIVELAQKEGVKEGESMQKQFETILRQKSQEFTYLGDTEKDIDLLTGDLRELGFKILNPKEEERRGKNG
jgi:hypothetical protein